MPTYTQWENTWTLTSINGTSVADGSNAETNAAISNDEKTETLVSVEVDYGSTANENVEVLILRETDDGPTYEQESDQPPTFAMPVTASTTHRRTFSIPAKTVADFKVALSNDSGASVTATVRTKQATVESV